MLDTDYPVCFQATNANGLSSKTCCVRLRVIKGDPLWSFSKVWNPRKACWNSCPWGNNADDDCVDVASASNCPAQGVQDVTVGCSYKMSIAVQLDNAAYNTRLRVQQQPHCEECLPGGIGVPACGEEGHVNGTACCGNSVCDGAETGMNCPQDCPMDTASLTPHPDRPGDPNWAEFSFTPSKIQQGRTLLTCIEVYDTTYGTQVIAQRRSGSRAPSMCVVYRVQSCRYCVPQGATLKSIAKHYLLNVDWLRLYNSNPDIPNPNLLIPSDMSDREPIYIGPRYTVQHGDTLLSIAAVMRTTVKSILENNPSVLAGSTLQVGGQLCLLLCSAAR
uniref:LysM domain-containing protein n=1 Tax=Hemiselmis andersenii TaxID=464988 RepID=A0A7S1DGV3_HEMAN|mmetsp:Transcript_12945/g.31701  ORF Transcript_12945/g.31701 Transcript_12945/m.31701 type:complete len:332 (+) Transcript_12945:8-1003(+)